MIEDILFLIILATPIVIIYVFFTSLIIFLKSLKAYKMLCNKEVPTYLEKKLDMKITSIDDVPQEVIKREKRLKKTFIIFSVILLVVVSVLAYFVMTYLYISSLSSIDKPIIYLYPEEETKITVKLENDQFITSSYPKYEKQWDVIASPNGDLIECETGRKLYALYYESDTDIIRNMNEGFVVKGEDAISFLEEKLAILGLNEREAEEFIVYWLPILEKNQYNLIRFETMEEIIEDMPLTITPKPDSLIRVIMLVKGMNKPIDIQEQVLETPSRNGFVAVEWGGRVLD